MLSQSYDIVFLGLTITSSWGNGHATTYRGLIRELSARGHKTLFLERDMPWYSENRDLPNPPYGVTKIYSSLADLKQRFTSIIQSAELVVVGSYVPEGVAVGEWVTHLAHGLTAFYDIDTPITLRKLLHRKYEYINPHLIPQYDMYLSFAGGPIIDLLENTFGSPMARPLYCSVDPDLYYPEKLDSLYDLGYMGTYSDDRQGPLEKLLIEPARNWKEGTFAVAGPQYPEKIVWPENVKRIEHLPPPDHRRFYCSQKFTLNITREDMRQAGFAPSVRLFEAAACGVPIISDYWEGLDSFFEFGDEIVLSGSSEETVKLLQTISDAERTRIGQNARKRIINLHTAKHRAEELEYYISKAKKKKSDYYLAKSRQYRHA